MILIMGQISLGVTSSRNYLIIKNARRQYTLYCWTMKILILETLIFLVSSQSINISRPEVATSGEDVFSNPFCDLLSCTNKNAVCLGKCCDCSCNYQRTYLTQSNECQANNNFRTECKFTIVDPSVQVTAINSCNKIVNADISDLQKKGFTIYQCSSGSWPPVKRTSQCTINVASTTYDNNGWETLWSNGHDADMFIESNNLLKWNNSDCTKDKYDGLLITLNLRCKVEINFVESCVVLKIPGTYSVGTRPKERAEQACRKPSSSPVALSTSYSTLLPSSTFLPSSSPATTSLGILSTSLQLSSIVALSASISVVATTVSSALSNTVLSSGISPSPSLHLQPSVTFSPTANLTTTEITTSPFTEILQSSIVNPMTETYPISSTSFSSQQPVHASMPPPTNGTYIAPGIKNGVISTSSLTLLTVSLSLITLIILIALTVPPVCWYLKRDRIRGRFIEETESRKNSDPEVLGSDNRRMSQQTLCPKKSKDLPKKKYDKAYKAIRDALSAVFPIGLEISNPQPVKDTSIIPNAVSGTTMLPSPTWVLDESGQLVNIRAYDAIQSPEKLTRKLTAKMMAPRNAPPLFSVKRKSANPVVEVGEDEDNLYDEPIDTSEKAGTLRNMYAVVHKPVKGSIASADTDEGYTSVGEDNGSPRLPVRGPMDNSAISDLYVQPADVIANKHKKDKSSQNDSYDKPGTVMPHFDNYYEPGTVISNNNACYEPRSPVSPEPDYYEPGDTVSPEHNYYEPGSTVSSDHKYYEPGNTILPEHKYHEPRNIPESKYYEPGITVSPEHPYHEPGNPVSSENKYYVPGSTVSSGNKYYEPGNLVSPDNSYCEPGALISPGTSYCEPGALISPGTSYCEPGSFLSPGTSYCEPDSILSPGAFRESRKSFTAGNAYYEPSEVPSPYYRPGNSLSSGIPLDPSGFLSVDTSDDEADIPKSSVKRQNSSVYQLRERPKIGSSPTTPSRTGSEKEESM